eukprot:Sspe_Gene.85996::Locus_56732_Transcript_1_1_Confidence_1.000_Length_1284::g.85996::m.85996
MAVQLMPTHSLKSCDESGYQPAVDPTTLSPEEIEAIVEAKVAQWLQRFPVPPPKQVLRSRRNRERQLVLRPPAPRKRPREDDEPRNPEPTPPPPTPTPPPPPRPSHAPPGHVCPEGPARCPLGKFPSDPEEALRPDSTAFLHSLLPPPRAEEYQQPDLVVPRLPASLAAFAVRSTPKVTKKPKILARPVAFDWCEVVEAERTEVLGHFSQREAHGVSYSKLKEKYIAYCVSHLARLRGSLSPSSPLLKNIREHLAVGSLSVPNSIYLAYQIRRKIQRGPGPLVTWVPSDLPKCLHILVREEFRSRLEGHVLCGSCETGKDDFDSCCSSPPCLAPDRSLSDLLDGSSPPAASS